MALTIASYVSERGVYRFKVPMPIAAESALYWRRERQFDRFPGARKFHNERRKPKYFARRPK